MEYFTGNVRIDPLFQGNAPARAAGASVTFEPGARTAWHTHPLGQALIVISGSGLVQSWGAPVEQIRPGDVVWNQPGDPDTPIHVLRSFLPAEDGGVDRIGRRQQAVQQFVPWQYMPARLARDVVAWDGR